MPVIDKGGHSLRIEAGPGVGHNPQGVQVDSGSGLSIRPHSVATAPLVGEMGDEWETIMASRRMNPLRHARTCYAIKGPSQVNPLAASSGG